MPTDGIWVEDPELLIELRDLEGSREWSRLEIVAKQVLTDCPISVNALMGL